MNIRKTTPHARRCSATALATAALLLTPATAFASTGPHHPAAGTAAHNTAAHGTASHGTASHGTATHRTGHAAGQAAGHGHRKAGKLGRNPEHKTSRPAGHPVHHGAAGTDSTDSTKPESPADPKAPNSTSKKTTPKKPQSGPMATMTKLSTSKNPTSARAVTLAARVSPAHRSTGAPKETGTVNFTVDGASSGPVPMSNNRASVKVKLSPGKHTASAKYSGDQAHSASDSGPTSFTVS